MHRCDYRISVVRTLGSRPTDRRPDSAILVGENQWRILRGETNFLFRDVKRMDLTFTNVCLTIDSEYFSANSLRTFCSSLIARRPSPVVDQSSTVWLTMVGFAFGVVLCLCLRNAAPEKCIWREFSSRFSPYSAWSEENGSAPDSCE